MVTEGDCFFVFRKTPPIWGLKAGDVVTGYRRVGEGGVNASMVTQLLRES